MVPHDVQTITKLEAAIQQVEVAIELFYAKRYAPAITLAGAAEGCLYWAPAAGETAPGDPDLRGYEPAYVFMKRGAKEKFGKTEKEAVARFNAVLYWLKHETPDRPPSIEVTNYEAWSMIFRAVTKIEAAAPGCETPAITRFIDFSREHYISVPRR